MRNRTTGVLYVLDEPSIGLHPSNIQGLNAVMHDLVADGNSVLLVDHDTQILSESDWIIEMGPEAGAGGGYVIAQGDIPQIIANPDSMIGPFLARKADMRVREQARAEEKFDFGTLHLSTDAIHTVKPLEVDIPKGRLTVVTGVSGSGKTTMVLESLIPGLEASLQGATLPAHVKQISAEGIAHVKLIDASPRMRMYTMNCGRYMQRHQMRRKRDIRQAISPIIPESCDVRCVMEQDRLASMCNSCQTWMYHVRNATDHGMGRKHGRSAMRRNRERSIPCHS